MLDVVEFKDCALHNQNRSLLHLVEHVGEVFLQPLRLLDFDGSNIWIFTVFQKARALVLAEKFDERRNIGLPVHGKSFELLENSIDTSLSEQFDGVLGVLVKFGVEDSLIYEVLVRTDVKKNPP